jgi:hypothetical protein
MRPEILVGANLVFALPLPPLGDHKDRPYKGGRMQLQTALDSRFRGNDVMPARPAPFSVTVRVCLSLSRLFYLVARCRQPSAPGDLAVIQFRGSSLREGSFALSRRA